jgi:tRNA threonylcarbamoyladenosine biosynthesis protein TsaE
MEKTVTIRSIDELSALAGSIAPHVSPGFLIGLTGDLGSGKTTFAQCLARRLGVVSTVSSPTFTIVKEHMGTLPFYHMDVYRLEGNRYDFSLDEYWFGEGCSVIEWVEYVRDYLPKDFLELEFIVQDDQTRVVTVKGSGTYEPIVEAIGR